MVRPPAAVGVCTRAAPRPAPRAAPVTVALHRYVENVITVNRTWPVDLTRMLSDDTMRRRREESVNEVETFLTRATDQGLLRKGLPEGWAGQLLPELMHLVARQLPALSPAQAADVVVDTLLHGLGAS